MHWESLRHLFESVCDLPPSRWREELERVSDDPVLIEEAMAMLQARTAGFERALEPLRDLLSASPEPELNVGERIGPWRLVRRLASGGMGTVFVAERDDESFRQCVAIKLLRSALADPALVQRLIAERQILADLRHANIARLYDGGTTPAGQPYLVMEYVEGVALDAYCQAHGLDLDARVNLFLKVCEAVQAAHRQLVVHCDLKPSNVLVRADGEPVLLDFGIARWMGAGGEEAAGFCTPAYASPELRSGSAPVNTASDVFSLGVLLAELLAGRRIERGLQDAFQPIAAPSEAAAADCPWRRHLRGDLDAIVARACAIEPASRYPSVEALAGDLQRHRSHHPITARAATCPYRLRCWGRRHWRAVALAGAASVVAMAFVGRLEVERARAEREAATAEQVSDFLVDTFNAADPRMRGAKGTEEPTARNVLDVGVAKVDAELAQSPAVLARMRLVLGRAYANLGERKRAEAMLRQAGDALQQPSIGRPDLAAQAYSHLSTLMSNQMRADDALAAAERSLALRTAHDRTPAALADAYNVLGLAKKTAVDFPGAQAAYAQALKLHLQVYGPDSLETAGLLHNMALLYRTEGDADAAESHYRRALAIKVRKAPRSVTLHTSRQGLAMVLASRGRFTEAAQLLRENVALAEALIGRESERVADTEMKLAMVLQQSGDYIGAGHHYREALGITERVLGRDSIDYAVVASQLATLEEQRGDLAAAEPLYRIATEIRRARRPAGDRTRVRNEVYWARVLARMGRMAEASALMERALPAWQGFFSADSDSPERINTRLVQAEWLLRKGRWDEARASLPEVPADNPSAALERQSLLAEIASRRGAPEALAEWKRAVAMSAGFSGADSAVTAQLRVPYAEALLASGDLANARRELASAEAPLRRQLSPHAEELRRIAAARARLRPPAHDARCVVHHEGLSETSGMGQPHGVRDRRRNRCRRTSRCR
nr:serine/threonine-protein kinase [Pseudoxanthomonas sp.]